MTAPGVLTEIAAVAGAARAEEEQIELLPPSRFAREDSRHGRMVESVRRDRAGRPPGARNLKTRDAIDFIRRVFGDPLLERARLALHTPESLAAELGCTKLEAFDRLDRIRADLARFIYPQLAPVDGQGNAVAPSFSMTIGARVVGVDGKPPWLYEGGPVIEESQQNQALLETPGEVSHAAKSHDEDKPL